MKAKDFNILITASAIATEQSLVQCPSCKDLSTVADWKFIEREECPCCGDAYFMQCPLCAYENPISWTDEFKVFEVGEEWQD